MDSVVLAGGQGQRVGYQQKALIDYEGQALLVRVLDVLKSQVAQVWVNANAELASYEDFSQHVFSDQYQGYLGPLAGMQAAWQYCKKDWLLFVPCDNPHIAPDLLQRLIEAYQQQPNELVVAYDGKRIQPLYLLMHRNKLTALTDALDKEHLSVKRWILEQSHTEADFADVAEQVFQNLNSLEKVGKSLKGF